MAERTHYMPVEALGMTEELAQEVEMRGASQKADWTHFTPEFVDTKVQSLNLDNLFVQEKVVRQNYMEARIGQKEGRVKFNETYPVAIAYLGDLHFGSIFSNSEEIRRKFDIIGNTPNLYAVFMSNLIDNGIPSQFPSNMLNNGITPDKQVVAMRKMIQGLNDKGKVLGAVTSPCHEGWTWKHTGQDINALLFGFEGRKFPVLENGARLHLDFPEFQYMGALYHQVGPFESNFNETHALKQLNRLRQLMQCDFVVGAHRHVGTVEMVFEGNGDHRKEVAYIRSGSEKGTGELHDQWSVGKYGATGEPSGQILRLWGNEKRMSVDLNFDTGVKNHLDGLYGELARRKSK